MDFKLLFIFFPLTWIMAISVGRRGSMLIIHIPWYMWPSIFYVHKMVWGKSHKLYRKVYIGIMHAVFKNHCLHTYALHRQIFRFWVKMEVDPKSIFRVRYFSVPSIHQGLSKVNCWDENASKIYEWVPWLPNWDRHRHNNMLQNSAINCGQDLCHFNLHISIQV